jgi:DNA-binding transcriptional ArsR family regulator
MDPEAFETLVRLLKSLADESRLKLLGLLAGGEYKVGELAELLNLREPTVSHHLARLQELDLVQVRSEGTTRRYRLKSDTLHRLSRELFTPTKIASIADNVMGDRWERKVLDTYFKDGKLTKIPETRKKRNVILKWLVNRFEEGERYPEAKINQVIKEYHPDSATLRRELIMTNLMKREKGIYWRTPAEEAEAD